MVGIVFKSTRIRKTLVSVSYNEVRESRELTEYTDTIAWLAIALRLWKIGYMTNAEGQVTRLHS